MKDILTECPNLFERNVYITMCVELTGKICLHQLTAAIEEAYKANGVDIPLRRNRLSDIH